MYKADLSVRRLAEFVCPGTDLYPPRNGRAVEPEEGIAVQKEIQAQRLAEHADYQREVSVQQRLPLFVEMVGLPGWPAQQDGYVAIQGRMDGLLAQTDNILIEEFKCCGELPAAVHPADRAQALIYAGLHAMSQQPAQSCEPASTAPHYNIAVVYVQVDSLAERVFSEQLSTTQVQAQCGFILLCYQSRVLRHLQRGLSRTRQNETLAFPFAEFRKSQQAIARRVYQALQQRQRLLLEAPTGSGKTMAVVYPAIRFQGLMDQIFYLTSRNVGAHAVLAAVQQLTPQSQHLVVVELTAKEKICPVPGTPCDAQQCQYARGYFRRSGVAVNNLLETGVADRDAVSRIAQQHQVCPFELSLDTALWADVVIADYNYLFDPMVRLQRFNGHPDLHLLIDEAHQLSPRTRDMLAVSFERQLVTAVIRSAGLLLKQARSIDRALVKLRRLHNLPEQELPANDLASFDRAVARLLDVVNESGVELAADSPAQMLWFACLRWQRSMNWCAAEVSSQSLSVQSRELVVRRICLDPAGYIDQILGEHGASVRFSATVSPLPLYQRLHGCRAQGVAERADSPFNAGQVKVLNIVDIPTYYRQRQASLPGLASLIAEIVCSEAGRYLIALPSYAYLQALAEVLSQHLPQAMLLVQQRDHDGTDHQRLLDDFARQPGAILLVVAGGVFGESVDFADTVIKGVVLVGLGLPPPSLERSLIQQYFDEQEGDGWGNMVAFTQPALVKNIQAAGRMIRSPEDRGIICLIDARFARQEVQQFLPRHWQLQQVRAAQVVAELNSFWQAAEIQVNS